MSTKGRQNRKGSRKWLASVMKSSGSKRRHIIHDGDYRDTRWNTHTMSRKGIDFEDQPKFEAMKRSRQFWNGKVNAAPLKRFLYNRVGSDWDVVYSEITNRLPSRLQDRKDDLISWFVCTKVELDGTGVLNISSHTVHRYHYIIKFDGSMKPTYDFYIDPTTNLLIKT